MKAKVIQFQPYLDRREYFQQLRATRQRSKTLYQDEVDLRQLLRYEDDCFNFENLFNEK